MMGRPSRITITQHEGDTELTEILKGDEYWLVQYDGEPIGIRTTGYSAHGIAYTKYPRTGYNNQRAGENLAASLNQKFNTQLFQCTRII